MTTTTRFSTLAVLLSLALAATLQAAEKPKKPEAVVTVNRYLGFRPANNVTKDSDYTFTLLADGKWHYRALVGGYEKRGDLAKGLAAWRKKLAKTGLAKLAPPKKPAIAVSDAPQVSIVWKDGDKTRRSKLAPNHKVAAAVHKLVQDLRQAAEKDV